MTNTNNLPKKSTPGRPPAEIPIHRVLSDISSTSIPLRELAKQYEVGEKTLWDALHSSPEISAEYARAIERRAHLEVQQMIDLEEQCIEDVKSEKVEPKAASALVQAYRMKADNVKWRATKLYPKLYGDRVEHNVNTISKEADDAYRARLNKLDPSMAVAAGAAASAEHAAPGAQDPRIPGPAEPQVDREQQPKAQERAENHGTPELF